LLLLPPHLHTVYLALFLSCGSTFDVHFVMT